MIKGLSVIYCIGYYSEDVSVPNPLISMTTNVRHPLISRYLLFLYTVMFISHLFTLFTDSKKDTRRLLIKYIFIWVIIIIALIHWKIDILLSYVN